MTSMSIETKSPLTYSDTQKMVLTSLYTHDDNEITVIFKRKMSKKPREIPFKDKRMLDTASKHI
jgi:hypothetical protein